MAGLGVAAVCHRSAPTDLVTARKVVLDLAEDESVPATHPGPPDNPAYQHILTVLTDAASL